MKKLTEDLKKEINILKLSKLPMFKENKSDFSGFKHALIKQHNLTDKSVKHELKKKDEDED